MTTIQDDVLYAHSARVKDKVVVITGAANGFGKETALRFASFGAKIVIGDRDLVGAQQVVATIKQTGGSAVCIALDVRNWDDQVDMFELAMKEYGSVDIVVPNAGVAEMDSFKTVKIGESDGRPIKPAFTTIDINLYGVLYTTHLAFRYLELNKTAGDLKSLIFIGSIASWQGIPGGELYTASKHAILGIMRSLYPIFSYQGIRVGVIHPFFSDTGIVPTPVKIVLAGIPLTPVSRVAGSIFYAATDPNPETNGGAWMLMDDGPLFLVPREEFKLGVYKMIDDRVNAAKSVVNGVTSFINFWSDIFKILRRPILHSLVVILALAISLVAWRPVSNALLPSRKA